MRINLNKLISINTLKKFLYDINLLMEVEFGCPVLMSMI